MDKLLDQFSKELSHIVSNEDLSLIKELVFSNKYSTLSQELKEQKILYLADRHLYFNPNASQPFIHYLVFDYKIDEDFYRKNSTYNTDQWFVSLFKIRKLKEQLGTELDESQVPKSKINKV